VRRSGEFNVLSIEELDAICREAATDQEAALFAVAAYTGLRVGELRAVRWRDIDFGNQTVHVRKNLPVHNDGNERTPKTKRIRSVPLIDDATRPLDKLSRRENLTGPDDLVFPSPAGHHFDPDEARDALYLAMSKAGVSRDRGGPRPFVLHDLRHVFGSLAVQIWPLADVQAYMGHADIATRQHDAADKLSALVTERTERAPSVPRTPDIERVSAHLRKRQRRSGKPSPLDPMPS
jgi:integrase